MRIGFLINDIRTEKANYTTTHLGRAALARGHEIYYIDLADFSLGAKDELFATAHRPPRRNYRSSRRLLEDLRSKLAVVEPVLVDTLDILFLRNDPAEDLSRRPWARLVGVNFGRLCVNRGVLVLNDPDGLAHAVNKIYLHSFSSHLRPCSIVTRNRSEIRAFAREFRQGIVLKPLTGSGGANVFLLQDQDRRNVNQILDVVLAEGYALAQEYLPEAEAGDVRLFLMNGKILESQGAIAALHRQNLEGDLRSNLTAGGAARPALVTDAIADIAEAIGPRLVQDGMFLVGVDIVGEKILEINVFSPGGLFSAQRLTGVDFSSIVIGALEDKISLKDDNREGYTNAQLATWASHG